MMMVVKERLRRCVCRARYKDDGLKSGPKFAPTFIVGTVYVDLRVLAGRMVGRIRNINKKGQLSYVTVVS